MTRYARPKYPTGSSNTLDTYTGKIRLTADGINEILLIKQIAELIQQYPLAELMEKLHELERKD